MRKRLPILIIISGTFLLIICTIVPRIIRSWQYPRNICDSTIYSDLSAEDLIGTWMSTANSDTYYEEIRVLDEETYQQNVVLGGTEYQSPEYSWRIERNDKIGTYLHFDQLRYCKGTSSMCQYEEGGGRDWLFYDSCNDVVLRMRGEGILLLLEIEGTELSRIYSSANGLVMKMMKTDSDNPAVYFVLTD